MILDSVQLPLGLLCLGIPSTVFCTSKVRQKLRKPARRYEEGVGALLRCPSNWIDLVRGGLGAWLIQRVFHNSVAGQDDLHAIYSSVQIVILLLGVLAQTVWLGKPIRIIGPAFFLTGMTFVVSGPAIGGLALTLGFTCALMLGRLTLAFYFVPVCLEVFALLFHQSGLPQVMNAFEFALPAFLAFPMSTRLAFARRTPAEPIPVRRSTLRVAPTISTPAEIPAPATAQEVAAARAPVLRPDFSPVRVIQMPVAADGDLVPYEPVPETKAEPALNESVRPSRGARKKPAVHGVH